MLSDILSAIDREDELYLDYWFLDCGSYKTAFTNPSNPNEVIKLCATDNDTDKEEEIYNWAQFEGVSSFFVPTAFGVLDSTYTTNFYEVDNIGEYDKYEIQPKVQVGCYNYCYPADIAKDLDYILSADELKTLDVCFKDWIEVALACPEQGVDALRKFIHFVEKYDIRDLHGGNLGFYQGKAVIIDWLSK